MRVDGKGSRPMSARVNWPGTDSNLICTHQVFATSFDGCVHLRLSFEGIQAHESDSKENNRGQLDSIDNNMCYECSDVTGSIVIPENWRFQMLRMSENMYRLSYLAAQ